MHHYYTGSLFDKVGVVPYQWARFEGRVVCYGAVTAYCVTSVCLGTFTWSDFFTSVKSGIKNNRFCLSAFCHYVGRAAVLALLPIYTALLGAAMGYVLQAVITSNIANKLCIHFTGDWGQSILV